MNISLQLPPISLSEMDSIRLMNRIDTKYLTCRTSLEKVLEDAAAAGYRIFEIDGVRLCGYDSLYYDTAGLEMYLAHQNGRLTRQKIRTRTYLDSGETYLEIKRKNNRGRTKKKRIPIDGSLFRQVGGSPEAASFLDRHSIHPTDSLTPALETTFKRITLVNCNLTERLTIDTDLRFINARTGIEASLGDAVVIELKQDGRTDSRMKEILLHHRVKPVRMSKYCIGEALTDPQLKSNRFKKKIRTIQKTINTEITVFHNYDTSDNSLHICGR